MENKTLENQVIITAEDFELLKPYANKKADGEMSLANELARAKVVKKEDFPIDCVRINSKVSILDKDSKNKMEFTLVLPQYSDMSKKQVSILTPMGAALIGFKQGDSVEWKLPAGLKRFEIISVINETL